MHLKLRYIYIPLALIGVLLEPLFSVNFITVDNWTYLFYLKLFGDLVLVLVFIDVLKSLLKRETRLLNKFVGLVIIGWCVAFFSLGMINSARDLLSGTTKYQGSCEVYRNISRYMTNSFMYLIDKDENYAVHIKYKDYDYLEGKSTKTSHYKCNRDVDIEYLNYTQVLLTL